MNRAQRLRWRIAVARAERRARAPQREVQRAPSGPRFYFEPNPGFAASPWWFLGPSCVLRKTVSEVNEAGKEVWPREEMLEYYAELARRFGTSHRVYPTKEEQRARRVARRALRVFHELRNTERLRQKYAPPDRGGSGWCKELGGQWQW